MDMGVRVGDVDGMPRMIGLIGTVGDGTGMVYMIHCDFWGKGYMTEALGAFVVEQGIFWELEVSHYSSHIRSSGWMSGGTLLTLKDQSHVKSLVARIDTENVGWMKTIEKIGARENRCLSSTSNMLHTPYLAGNVLMVRP